MAWSIAGLTTRPSSSAFSQRTRSSTVEHRPPAAKKRGSVQYEVGVTDFTPER